MLCFGLLHRCNVQREQAGIVLSIMHEQIICKRLSALHVHLKILLYCASHK